MAELKERPSQVLDGFVNLKMEEIWDKTDDARAESVSLVRDALHDEAHWIPKAGIDVPDAEITCALDGVDSEVLEGWIGVKVCREMIRHLEEAICHYEDLYKD